MPVEPPLTPEERRVLDVLMEHGRPPAERTDAAIPEASALDADGARRALRTLEERQPPLVQSEIDAGLDARIWAATPAALDVDD